MTDDRLRPWKVLAVASAGGFMAFLDQTVVNIAFPSLERSFPSATRSELSWVLSGYSIVFTALLVPGGRIADSLGLRRWFFIGLGMFTAASGACAAAPSPEILVAGRVVQAAGGAVLIPAAIASILLEFPPERRSHAIALYGGVAAIAAAAGPALGGIIIDSGSWRWIFLLNVPIGLAAGFYGYRILRDARTASSGLPDFLGVLLVTAGVGLLALAIVQGEDWGWTSTRVMAAFAGAALLIPLFLARSAAHPAPVVELSLFRIRSVAVANIGTLLLGVAFFGSLLAQVLFLNEVWKYSALDAGLALTPAPLVAAAVAGFAGRLAERYEHRLVSVAGALILAASGVWYATQLGVRPDFIGQWLPGNVLLGMGLGLAYSTLISASVIELPAARYAVGSGINTMMRQVGAVLGVASIIAIVGTPSPADALDAFDNAWLFITILALAAAFTSLAVPRIEAPRESLAGSGMAPGHG